MKSCSNHLCSPPEHGQASKGQEETLRCAVIQLSAERVAPAIMHRSKVQCLEHSGSPANLSSLLPALDEPSFRTAPLGDTQSD